MTKQRLSDSQATIWAAYQRMRVRLNERLNREIAQATGLSEADFEILTALTEMPDQSVRALALRCGLAWEKSRLSHQLRRMEARGLLVRELCEEDNRSAIIRVTETGRTLAAQAQARYQAAISEVVVDALTPEQLQQLGEIAENILNALGEPTHTSAHRAAVKKV